MKNLSKSIYLYLYMLTMKRVHASTKHWGSVVVVIISTSTLYVTLEHKSGLKSHRYVCSNSTRSIVWVKMIDFSFMPKILFHEDIL